MPKKSSPKNFQSKNIQSESDKLKSFQIVLEYIRDNAGCEEDSHRHPYKGKIHCVACIAKQALLGLSDPWAACEEDGAPFQLDEMPAGDYYARIGGYHDYFGVHFDLVPISTKLDFNKNVWDLLPKKNATSCYSKQIPQFEGNSGGAIIEITIYETGGYMINRVIRKS